MPLVAILAVWIVVSFPAAALVGRLLGGRPTPIRVRAFDQRSGLPKAG